MPCAASLPKRRLEPLVDFLFTEAAERGGSFSCGNPPPGSAQRGSLKPSTVVPPHPLMMDSTVPGAMERVALGRMAPGQAAAAGARRTGAPRFPWRSPRAGPGAGAGQERWPWLPANPSTPGPVLFPFGKGLLLHRHRRETLPQQLPALLPAEGGCGEDKPQMGGGEQPPAPRHREACTDLRDNVSCLFTGVWSQPGRLQRPAPSGLVFQCRECPGGHRLSRETVGAARG